MPRADFLRPARFLFCLLLLGVTASCTSTPSRTAAPAAQRRIDSAIAHVRPALVRIRVVSADFGEGREIKQQGVGSGAIITKDGYIITNHHVAGHARRIFCTLWDREEIEADLIGTDALTDISVIKLRAAPGRDFHFVTFGDSAALRVGDSVLAMGSPMALSQSVTLGIVSNTEMVMPRFWGSRSRLRLDGEDVGALVRWIAHDAAIYGGNSGGPLVDLEGDIIGINEISYGLSGAIPGNLARSVAEELIAKGVVQRSWIGIDVQPLFKRADEKRGVLVSGVLTDSPASRAGLQAGDLLLSLNEQEINVRFDEQMPEFMKLSTGLPIGKEVPIIYRRDGKDLTGTVVPVERGEIFPKQQELKQWGLTVRNISPLAARELKRETRDGVLVTSVRPGGPAGEAKPSIDARDIIVDVDGTPIKRAQDLVELTSRLTEGKTERVPVIATFERKAAKYLAVVHVGIQELKDPGLEVTKAWLPVETQVISREIARELGQPDLRGFYITRVYPGSSAEKAGLQPGDFITAVDGENLTATGAEHDDELRTLIRQYDVDKSVDLRLLRNKAQTNMTVQLIRSPRLQREMKKYRNEDFEFTARDVSFFDSAQEQWDQNQSGALVEDVRSGSWSELGGLYVGDLILQVDSRTIRNVEELRQVMEQVSKDRKSVVIMKVLRGIRTSYLEMEPNWKTE
ncbi:MAG TPA: PDZ domain-containing protein [Verrucomicrobiae bacterium]|nr:PDZ domain-containing protein [Verrucomicrobiae bacterium]